MRAEYLFPGCCGRSRRYLCLPLVIGMWLLLACGEDVLHGEEFADLVITGGRIVTMDQGEQPEALAIQGDRILRVGSLEDVAAVIGPQTERVELDDQLVMPGFIESHGHLIGMGQLALSVNLSEAYDWEEAVEMVQRATETQEAGQWIVGRGWHQEKWQQLPEDAIEGCPTHEALSAVTPDHPVILTHASGHMAIANARAMALAGVDATTPDPRGGQIVRDEEGKPTGVLREKAAGLVSRLSDRFQDAPDRIERAIELAAAECLRNGVTSFQDAGTSFQNLEVLVRMAEAGRLPVRTWIMIRDSNENLAAKLPRFLTRKDASTMARVRGIKRSLDGALGAHGAWLLEPYDDMTTTAGLNTYPLDDLEQTARLALQHDCQLCVHAIGDRANRETLDLFERMLAGDREKRWRIEHAQHLHPDDVPRFAQLGVIPVMQGIHCTSDAVFVIQRLGMRRAGNGAYLWRSLLDSGARIANGTDVPVEAIDPIACFYATVTRKLDDGAAFFPEEAMTRMEALRSYTIDAAYAAFEEDEKGSLSEGKLADIVILSQDLLTCPEEKIRETVVEMTILGGDVVHRQP
ncbi:MAG: amidohydrolase [Planctomycetota bacterium]